ncbi:MAG: rhodanese-like domain-containing protein [Cyanobacteria bacterium]|nr:rhodanese-like domain-containing protein [Cyanobacteriota bacterium]
MPRSLPPIHSPAPALTPSAAAHSLGPLEVAQRLARPELAAAAKVDPSTLLVVDVRSRRQFARGHLPHSHPIPAGLLVSGEWPDGDLLLVDDGTGEAERVREALHNAGYPRRILQLAGGFEAWRAAGFPVEGSRPSWFWPRWLGRRGPTAPALADLQDLLGNADLDELLGSDELLPDLAGLRRA